jgi:hypothetical protein
MIKKSWIVLLSMCVIGSKGMAQNESFQIKKFVLDNGLTVILNPDPNAVGVYGAVAVKAGSKNDPADATGMAHYLMLLDITQIPHQIRKAFDLSDTASWLKYFHGSQVWCTSR